MKKKLALFTALNLFLPSLNASTGPRFRWEDVVIAGEVSAQIIFVIVLIVIVYSNYERLGIAFWGAKRKILGLLGLGIVAVLVILGIHVVIH